MRTRGPQTPGGKAAIRHNAVSHGVTSLTPVLRGERTEDWQRHLRGIVDSLKPENHLQYKLAERVALLSWRLDRVTRYECDVVDVWQEQVDEDIEDEIRREGAEAFGRANDSLSALGFTASSRRPTDTLVDADARAVVLRSRFSRDRMLPSSEVLERITRYETHLAKQFYQALHELEAMQKRSEGKDMPLARLDVIGLPE